MSEFSKIQLTQKPLNFNFLMLYLNKNQRSGNENICSFSIISILKWTMRFKVKVPMF